LVHFYYGTTNPNNSTRLNLDADLRVTYLGVSNTLTVASDTSTGNLYSLNIILTDSSTKIYTPLKSTAASESIFLYTSNGGTTGTTGYKAGDIIIYTGSGGSGSSSGGSGGKLILKSGVGASSSTAGGSGGDIDVSAGYGAGASSPGSGGSIRIYAGNSGGTTNPGSIHIIPGATAAGSWDNGAGAIYLATTTTGTQRGRLFIADGTATYPALSFAASG